MSDMTGIKLKGEGKNLAEIVASRTLRNQDENRRIVDSLEANSALKNEEKVLHLIASRYLNSVSKGLHALELALTLDANLVEASPQKFAVPTYISEAVNWVC